MEPESAAADTIREEVARIVASSEFDASERNRRFLTFAVEEVLAGRGDRIKAYTVATTVFGRSVDFDPQVDSIVRIEAGRLRRSLERYYLTAGTRDRIRIIIPKGSYVPVFSPVDPSVGAMPRNAGVREGGGDTIFVRPFEEEGDHARFPNFANGFTRQVISGLTRFTDIVVYGPETSLAFGTGSDLAQLRSMIDFDYVLSGGVMIAGDVVGVEALLTDARTGRYVWAESFSSSFDPSGIVALRDDIANRVVRSLAQPYGVLFTNRAREAEGRAASSMSAYEAVTRFYVYARTYDRATFPDVFAAVGRVVAQDPDYAEGLACLSRLWVDVHRFGFDHGVPEPAPLDRAAALAGRAVDLAPRSSRCHHALGLAAWLRGEFERSLGAYETGLSLNPNDTDLMAELGFRCTLRLDFDRGVPLLEESFRRNPAQPGTYRVALALWHLWEGRDVASLEEARRTGMPHLPHGAIIEAAVAGRLGDVDAARCAVKRILATDPEIAASPVDWLSARGVHPALVKLLVEGLVDAGLPVPESQVLRAG
jgi:adenylate cyclase